MYTFFLDESGDPSFYASGNKSLVGKPGFMPLLLLGMIKTKDKDLLRKAVVGFINNAKNDPELNCLPCINGDPNWYPHASFDNKKLQLKFIQFIDQLEIKFTFFCVIGRKILSVFHNKHNKNESEFYYDMVYHLIKDRLNYEDVEYKIFLAKRTKPSPTRLKNVIEKAIERDNNKRKKPVNVKFTAEIVVSKDTPELCIADYLLWSLQRYILRGDKANFEKLSNRYSLIIDLYDFEKHGKSKFLGNYYHVQNPFSVEKASEFKRDGYL